MLLWATCAIATSLATQALATELGAPRWAAFAAARFVAIAPATLLYVHHVGPEIATAAALTASALSWPAAPGGRRSRFWESPAACVRCSRRRWCSSRARRRQARRVPALVVFAVLALLA